MISCAIPPSKPSNVKTTPRRQLTLFDSTSMIVGIIIGAGIFETTPRVAAEMGTPASLLGVWMLGGIIALIGSLSYAELATAYPIEGGDYVYLSRAFGLPMGFLFAWSEFFIVRPGNVGMMAYVFARFANQLQPLRLGGWEFTFYAAAATVLLTVINVMGVRAGKWTQNVLSAVKILGLSAVFLVGVLGSGQPSLPDSVARETTSSGFYLATILVLFTYGGWRDMSFVAAEIRNPKKNIVRALLLGTAAVTSIYLLVNLAFLRTLGLEGMSTSRAVAADAVSLRLGARGVAAIDLLIVLSCLGAINGMLFTGSRVMYAMATEHRVFRWAGAWSLRRDSPVRALLLQAAVTMTLVIAFGPDENAFQRLVIFTTPVYSFFLLMVGVALFVLRRTDPKTPRPFKVVFFPVTPLLFCGACVFMLFASTSYAYQAKSHEALWSFAILVAGIWLSIRDHRHRRRRQIVTKNRE